MFLVSERFGVIFAVFGHFCVFGRFCVWSEKMSIFGVFGGVVFYALKKGVKKWSFLGGY